MKVTNIVNQAKVFTTIKNGAKTCEEITRITGLYYRDVMSILRRLKARGAITPSGTIKSKSGGGRRNLWKVYNPFTRSTAALMRQVKILEEDG